MLLLFYIFIITVKNYIVQSFVQHKLGLCFRLQLIDMMLDTYLQLLGMCHKSPAFICI